MGGSLRPGFRGVDAVRLMAVAAPEVFAAALNRPWPDDLDGRVRCLDEGARALGLAMSCVGWSPAAEDAALTAELDPGSDPAPALTLDSADPSAVTGLASTPGAASAPSLSELDAVAAGLAQTPGALGVLGAVSGPAALSARVGDDSGEALDDASDLAAARVRALGACGVDRAVVVEAERFGFDADQVAEAHEPILRIAEHLRLDVLLIVAPASGATGDGTSAAATGAAGRAPSANGTVTGCDPARLGYERWAGPGGCSDGLVFLPAGVFKSTSALNRGLDERRAELAGAAEAITAPLRPGADPAAVRAAVARLAELAGREPAGLSGRREGLG